MSDREFDVVVYGASGFTGRLVAEYLGLRYGNSQSWAMAGRNASKLETVRDEIGAPADTPILTADASDSESLRALVKRARCIATTVGPYQLYGSELVQLCAEEGTHYVDLCGEPGWMHDMINQHADTAKQSGARIVFSCGFDSIPFDLGVYFLQQEAIKQTGHPMPRVRGRVRAMVGEFSGGTAASLGATMAAVRKNPALAKVLTNPFSLAEGFQGPEQPADNAPYLDEVAGSWVAPFIMAAINTKNVHRSNALLKHQYGENFEYDEMMMTGPGEQGEAIAQAVSKTNPLAGDDVPQPGEGPSKESREAGSYDVAFIGTNDAGDRIQVAVKGDLDPGYGSTSKMIAESALCLVQDCAELPGGIYTPAPAMGEKLIARLIDNAGISFEIE
jgi:short subunit dehydrogenase-like uncharacterized protein